MFDLAVTPELLSYLLAGLVAILFDWFPVLNAWYGDLSSLKKQQIMAGMLAVIVAVIYGLGCAGILGGMTCDQGQIAVLVKIYFVAIGVNQGMHMLTKPTGVG
jgi:hypothetical protein